MPCNDNVSESHSGIAGKFIRSTLTNDEADAVIGLCSVAMDESATVPLSQIDVEEILETAEDGEEEDNSSYSCSDGDDSDSLVSVEQEDDTDLDVEAIDDIPKHERVSKALEDYELQGELFLHPTSKDGKKKKKD